MKAVLCTHFGTADELEVADIPEPQAGPGEAVVRVKAAALNFFDTLIVAGKYQYKPPFPFSPAAEFAGIVESVGAGVTELAPGDRVMGHMGWGAAREAVAISVRQLAKLPDALDFERAAGLNVIYATTLYALRDRAQLEPGETLAVLGASGGKADHQIAAEPGQRAHRRLGVRAADRVIDHVDAVLAAEPPQRVAQILAGIVHRLVGAVGAGEGELFVGGGAGDDARAHHLAELYGRKPGAAGGAEHGQGLARLELGAVAQRVKRRGIDHVEARGALEIERVGQLGELPHRNGDSLARRAPAHMTHDAVAGRELGHA